MEDWREVIIELEILPRWPFSIGSTERRTFVEHNLDGVIMHYNRPEYVKAMLNAIVMVEKFYERFRPLLRNITVNSNLAHVPPPQITSVPPPMKRARFPT